MPDKFTRAAEKLIKKMPKSNEIFDFPRGYNLAKDEDIPIVADLLKQIDELKGLEDKDDVPYRNH